MWQQIQVYSTAKYQYKSWSSKRDNQHFRKKFRMSVFVPNKGHKKVRTRLFKLLDSFWIMFIINLDDQGWEDVVQVGTTYLLGILIFFIHSLIILLYTSRNRHLHSYFIVVTPHMYINICINEFYIYLCVLYIITSDNNCILHWLVWPFTTHIKKIIWLCI